MFPDKQENIMKNNALWIIAILFAPIIILVELLFNRKRKEMK